MSSSGPAKPFVLAALLAGGCMKIYPDAELPDIEASWKEFECPDGTSDVHVVVVDHEDETVAAEATVPCSDGSVTIRDVARRRFAVGGVLLAVDGTRYSSSYANEADLRDGLGARVFMYFGSRADLEVGWRFDGGGRCATFDATSVVLEVTTSDGELLGTLGGADCRVPPLLATIGPDAASVGLRAVDDRGAVVAVSPAVAVSVDPQPDARLDLGTLVLSPCAPSCP